MSKRKKPELLVPASSLEVLKTAVMFGADAVYIGGEAFGLRAKAKNFSKEDRVEINKNINFATPDILIAINKRLINSHFISLTEAYRKYKMDNEL